MKSIDRNENIHALHQGHTFDCDVSAGFTISSENKTV